MAATDAQITEIRDLHALGADYSAAIPLTEWDQSVGQYNYNANDPKQLAETERNLARVTFALTPPKGDAALMLNTATPTVDLQASLTFMGNVNIDSAFTYYVKAGALTVDANGLVTYDVAGHPYSSSDVVYITWKKNPAVETTRTIFYNV